METNLPDNVYARRREVIKDLKLDLDYVTAEQAERAGLVFSKKWVDAGKPNLPKL
jgi:hypothetical protein